jgi:hypothetical protein
MSVDWLPKKFNPHRTVPLSWEQLMGHVFFSVLPWSPTGGGALAYLYMLKDCARVTLQDSPWEKEIEVCIDAVNCCNLPHGQNATAKDLSYKYVRLQELCCDARKKAKYSNRNDIDKLYLHSIVFYAAQGKVLPVAILSGITQLYKSLVNASPHAMHSTGWQCIVDGLESKKTRFSDHLPFIKQAAAQDLAKYIEPILSSPIPALKNQRTIDEIRKNLGPIKVVENITLKSQASANSRLKKVVVDFSTPPKKTVDKQMLKKFTRGDSVMKYLMAGLKYQTRLQRLGISNKDSIPIEHMSQITKSLVLRLKNPVHMSADEQDANLLALLQTSLPFPFHVLMNVSLVNADDIRLDVDQGCIRFNMGRMLKLVDIGRIDEKQIVLPLPLVVAEALRKRLLVSHNAVYLSDLFGVELGATPWKVLKAKHSEELKKFSDVNLKAWAGKWIKSIGNVYLHVLGNNLEAAVCGLSPRLVNGNILHYFHPNLKDLEKSCNQVFAYLGLGPAQCVVPDAFQFYGKNPTQDDLRKGFDAMLSELISASRVVMGNKSLIKKIESFNQCSQISLAMLVFSLGGRGSKPEEITNGSIFGSSDLLYWNDKKVEEDRGPRLIPKTSLTKRLLTIFGYAQEAMAKDLVKQVPIFKNEVWYEIAQGEYRFNASAFNMLEMNGQVVERRPIVAKAIEDLSMRHFRRSKNFMRHVLITQWSIEQRDHNLLRVITGHATRGLEMPAAASVYSPASAIKASGAELESILKCWVAPSWFKKRGEFKCRFTRLPVHAICIHARRSQNVVNAALVGPQFDSSYIAAEQITKQLRDQLLCGNRPSCNWAGLWLHMLVFDGLTESIDLEIIFKNAKDSFALSSSGWCVRWRRLGDMHDRIVPLQIPTALYINEYIKVTDSFDLVTVLMDIDHWLNGAIVESSGHRDVIDSPIDLVTSAVTLWLGLSLPTTLQLAYSNRQFAPIPTTTSSLKLLGLSSSNLEDTVKNSLHTDSSNEEFAWIYSLINKIGSNKNRLGELRACANFYDAKAAQRTPLTDGSWAQAIHLCIRCNNDLIRTSNPKRLKFSSVSKYLGTLHHAFVTLAHCAPSDLNEIDFLEISKIFFAVAIPSIQDENSSHDATRRQAAQHAAATWFFKMLQSAGFPVPNEIFTAHREKKIRPQKVTAVSHITAHEFRSGIDLSAQWNSEVGLKLARLDAASTLLQEVPMRWMECAGLTSSSLLTMSSGLVIKPVGLSHLKSHHSHRVLPISNDLSAKLMRLKSRVCFKNGSLNSDQFLFLDPQNQSIGATANWLHKSMTQSLSLTSHDTNFRVHHFRAKAICNNLFPNWEKTLHGWLAGRLGPNSFQAYFAYTKENAWRVDEVCSLAGHSHPRTTILFYFYTHHFVRAMALSSLFAFERPCNNQLRHLKGTQKTHRNSPKRDKSGRIDHWLLPVQSLANQSESESTFVGRSELKRNLQKAVHTNELTQKLAVVDAVKYLSVRLLKFETVHALDRACISISNAQFLEKIIVSKRGSVAFALIQKFIDEFDYRELLAISDFEKTVDFTSLFRALHRCSKSELRCVLHLFIHAPVNESWESCLMRVADIFKTSKFFLEIIFDPLYINLAKNARLAQHRSIRFGVPMKRLGERPHITLVPIDKDLTDVAKRRLKLQLLMLGWALLVFNGKVAE